MMREGGIAVTHFGDPQVLVVFPDLEGRVLRGALGLLPSGDFRAWEGLLTNADRGMGELSRGRRTPSSPEGRLWGRGSRSGSRGGFISVVRLRWSGRESDVVRAGGEAEG